MNVKRIVTCAVILGFCLPASGQIGTKKKRPLPYEYGSATTRTKRSRPSCSSTGSTARSSPAGYAMSMWDLR